MCFFLCKSLQIKVVLQFHLNCFKVSCTAVHDTIISWGAGTTLRQGPGHSSPVQIYLGSRPTVSLLHHWLKIEQLFIAFRLSVTSYFIDLSFIFIAKTKTVIYSLLIIWHYVFYRPINCTSTEDHMLFGIHIMTEIIRL